MSPKNEPEVAHANKVAHIASDLTALADRLHGNHGRDASRYRWFVDGPNGEPQVHDVITGQVKSFSAKKPIVNPRVYFAGKISKSDWRTEILGDRALVAGIDEGALFNPSYEDACDGFINAGPFFVSCDHGCAHTPFMHGADLTAACFSADYTRDGLRRKIYAINRHRLLRSDLVFCYLGINGTTAFGTMLELGMAAQAKKPIALAFSAMHKQYDDLWMLRAAASNVYYGTPASTWQTFCRDFGIRAAEQKTAPVSKPKPAAE